MLFAIQITNIYRNRAIGHYFQKQGIYVIPNVRWRSDLYKGTYGDRAENIPDFLKREIRLPENEAQLKHIFRETEGHLTDTPENRQLIEDLANNKNTFIGKDNSGLDWHSSMNNDGSQNWVSHMSGIIQDAGRNSVPRHFDEMTGLNHNIHKDLSWRKRK